MRVAIIYNEPKAAPPEEHWLTRSGPGGAVLPADFCDASEYGVLQETQQIEGFLQEAGHETVLFAADDAAQLAGFLERERPGIIFNCCESFHGIAGLEMNIAALYELFDIPYTGSPPMTLGVALNKGLAKAVLQAHGIPTPSYAILGPRDSLDEADKLAFPAIVKPLCDDASNGIDRHAVVDNPEALARRIRFIHSEFRQPALVEEFIDGRELNVAVLAASPHQFVTLPISEIVFGWPASQGPRIVSYEAKWLVNSAEYGATAPRCPAELSPQLAERVRDLALQAAQVIGLRDYGRVDMRLRATDNAVFVIEVNPNPDITYDSGFVRAAQASGRTHAGVIREILERAMERSR